MSWDGLEPASLQAGNTDVGYCWMTDTADRRQRVDLLKLIMNHKMVLIVRKVIN